MKMLKFAVSWVFGWLMFAAIMACPGLVAAQMFPENIFYRILCLTPIYMWMYKNVGRPGKILIKVGDR